MGFRYANEHEVLWCRVLCAKTEANISTMLLDLGQIWRGSTLPKTMSPILDLNKQLEDAVEKFSFLSQRWLQHRILDREFD